MEPENVICKVEEDDDDKHDVFVDVVGTTDDTISPSVPHIFPRPLGTIVKPRFVPRSDTARKRVIVTGGPAPEPKRINLADLRRDSLHNRLAARNSSLASNLNLLAATALDNRTSNCSALPVNVTAVSVCARQGPFTPQPRHDPIAIIRARLTNLRRAQIVRRNVHGQNKGTPMRKGIDIRPRFYKLPTVDVTAVDVFDKVGRAVELLDVKQRKEYTRTKHMLNTKCMDQETLRRIDNLKRHRERKQQVMDEKDHMLGTLAAIAKAQHEFIIELDALVRHMSHT